MSELERQLTALARGGRVAGDAGASSCGSSRRRPGARGGAALVLAIALVAGRDRRSRFAVPPARSAILDFFHLGGVTVERVADAAGRGGAPARRRPRPAGDARARPRAILGGPVRLPRVNGEPQLYEREGVDLGGARDARARARERSSRRSAAARC